jgi:hypothetical protein
LAKHAFVVGSNVAGEINYPDFDVAAASSALSAYF